MDIGEVARQSGFPPSTLRYYEDIGLIASIGRHGLRRVYDAEVLGRLALISLGRSAGFSLRDIAEMFSARKVEICRDTLRDKAAEIDREISRLVSVRDGLLHAADCSASNHLQCATFQRLLALAAKRQQKQASGRRS